MGLYRLRGDENGREGVKYEAVPLDDWLDDLQAERDALMMRLRAVERPLIKHGRLKVESLPRRER